jgi:hypothetical protein
MKCPNCDIEVENSYIKKRVKMDTEKIAYVCHQVNKAYCESIGDDSQKDWENSPEWQKLSAINGVNAHLLDPNLSPASSHELWMEEKRNDGWKHGFVKDPVKKEHPCFVPYSELPIEQRTKDYLFKEVVRALKFI